MSYYLAILTRDLRGEDKSSFRMIISALSPSSDTYLALSQLWFMNLLDIILPKLSNIHKCQHDSKFMIEKEYIIYQISKDFLIWVF